MPIVTCQNCHGKGVVAKEVKPGKWEDQRCIACGGTGKINTKLI